MLQEALDSPWHHPAVGFLSVFSLTLVVVRRMKFEDGFVVLFGLVILADALVTGPLSPVPSPSPLRTSLEVLFVILGDFRFFLLLERYSRRGLTVFTFLRAAVVGLIVPVSATVLIKTNVLVEPRHQYLFWEVSVFALALVLRFVVIPRRYARETGTGGRLDLISAITAFELVQYGLWAFGDALILRGQEWGKLLRMSADILYYGAFLPFVWLRTRETSSRLRAVPATIGMVAAGLLVSFVGVFTRPSAAQAPNAQLTFLDHDRKTGTVSLSEMKGSMPVETVEGIDPYYEKKKKWRAVPIEVLVAKGFGRDLAAVRKEDLILRALDGYATVISGERLLEGGAHVAIADVDAPAWEPIGPQHAHPAPFYLVWSKPAQGELKTHPRPWQLASIEIISFDRKFPHLRPENVTADSAAERGFQTFRARCIACHAINGSGGHVGPDLNVPQNILEYRPAADVRAYIRNPRAFRYGSMPPHLDLSEPQLDELVSFFETKKTQKHDPNPSGGSH